MLKEIELGDKVKDINTGFVGIVTARTEFLNGCVQFNVIPRVKENKMPEEMSIDRECLVVIKKKLKPKEKPDSNGGPMRKAVKQRGY